MNRIEVGIGQKPELTDADLQKIFGQKYKDEVLRKLLELGLFKKNNLPKFSDPPGRHKDSEAYYLIEVDKGNKIIYVQYLPPNSQSSEHSHDEPVEEDFYVVKGTVYVNNIEISEGQNFTVKPNTFHMAETRDKHALTILVTRNVEGKPRDQLHKKRV